MTSPQIELQKITKTYQSIIQNSDNLNDLSAIRSSLIGRKGSLTLILRSLPNLDPTIRPEIGRLANQLKTDIELALTQRQQDLHGSTDSEVPNVDLSEPKLAYLSSGHIHPTQAILADIYKVFQQLGFAIVDGPEIETDWYNFEVLNMPSDHPARDMQDTFYIESDGKSAPLVPRTHTSASQIRYMETHQPPFQVLVPGKAYRNEDEDKTHVWSFFQVEGLVIGKNIGVAELKGTLLHVVKDLLGEEAKIRLRPSYFPYTEPSFEIDIWYRDEWLEICGAGVVHPDVLRRGGIDPEVWSGFAFGLGPDRLSVIRYDLSDIRMLWRPNLLESTQI